MNLSVRAQFRINLEKSTLVSRILISIDFQFCMKIDILVLQEKAVDWVGSSSLMVESTWSVTEDPSSILGHGSDQSYSVFFLNRLNILGCH